jgi:S1-C subfamily serine protease
VLEVDAGSAASAAGTQVGDVITSVNDSSAASSKSRAYPSLSDLLESLVAPSQVLLTVVRDGSTRQLSLTLPTP